MLNIAMAFCGVSDLTCTFDMMDEWKTHGRSHDFGSWHGTP